MRFLSVCSGIEAASVAWAPLGWEAVAFAEIEAFPRAVLAHHYPSTPNWGDMTQFKRWPDATFDVLCGGTPCQSFSVAGLRKGLADPRGNLALTYLAIADRYRPRWMVWENVPGVLSSNEGRDFGAFLGALGKLGYGFAYRVLDAQYFGLAQRRKRVFVVAHFGDWRRAAAVLFEPQSLRWDHPPRREAREDVAGTLAARSGGGGFPDGGDGRHSQLVAFGGNNTAGEIEIATARRAKGGTGHGDFETETFIAHALCGEGFDASEDGTGRGTSIVPIAYRITGNDGALGTNTDRSASALLQRPGVRRLTPREFERLQGFPDDYTRIPVRSYKKQPRGKHFLKYPDLYQRNADGTWTRFAADGPRYKGLGNSMAVPVMRWIGEGIAAIDQLEPRP